MSITKVFIDTHVRGAERERIPSLIEQAYKMYLSDPWLKPDRETTPIMPQLSLEQFRTMCMHYLKYNSWPQSDKLGYLRFDYAYVIKALSVQNQHECEVKLLNQEIQKQEQSITLLRDELARHKSTIKAQQEALNAGGNNGNNGGNNGSNGGNNGNNGGNNGSNTMHDASAQTFAAGIDNEKYREICENYKKMFDEKEMWREAHTSLMTQATEVTNNMRDYIAGLETELTKTKDQLGRANLIVDAYNLHQCTPNSPETLQRNILPRRRTPVSTPTRVPATAYIFTSTSNYNK